MLKTKIFFPRGCGGHWLSNLIWHLETNDYTLPLVDIVFDGQPTSNNIQIDHVFEVQDPTLSDQVTMLTKQDKNILFSTDCMFNIYLNDATKVKLGPMLVSIRDKSLLTQYFTLTDNALYLTGNQLYKETYCCDIDLDYRLVFQNPSLFVDNLFSILDTAGLRYTPNKEYALTNIEYYKTTCANPADHIGNLDSLVWLSWCHALLISHGIPLSGVATEESTLEDLKQLIMPLADWCLEQTDKSMYFLWNHE